MSKNDLKRVEKPKKKECEMVLINIVAVNSVYFEKY